MRGSWRASIVDFCSEWVGRIKKGEYDRALLVLACRSGPIYWKEGYLVVLQILERKVAVQTSWVRTCPSGRPKIFCRTLALSCCEKKASLFRQWYKPRCELLLLLTPEDNLCIHPTFLPACGRQICPSDCRSSIVKFGLISGFYPWNLTSYLQLYHCLVRYCLSLQTLLLWNSGHSHYPNNTEERNAPVNKLSERQNLFWQVSLEICGFLKLALARVFEVNTVQGKLCYL